MGVVFFALFLLLMAVEAGLAALLALAVGSLLSHIFAVTTFEATVVVLVAAVTTLVLAFRNAPPSGDIVPMTDDEPMVVFDSFPLPPRRQRRRKS